MGLCAQSSFRLFKAWETTDNAFIESFNSRFRQECLNEHWFLSIEDARVKIVEWWREYNSHRPHSSLGYMTPEEFANLEAISTC